MTVAEMPEAVRGTLAAFVESVKQTFADDLRAIVLYGSAAEGRMRATSDVNLIVVLHRFDEQKANRLREPFRFAQAAIDLKVMFLLDGEIADASEEFAQKFADVRRRHVVLFGDDPFAALDIPRAALTDDALRARFVAQPAAWRASADSTMRKRSGWPRKLMRNR